MIEKALKKGKPAARRGHKATGPPWSAELPEPEARDHTEVRMGLRKPRAARSCENPIARPKSHSRERSTGMRRSCLAVASVLALCLVFSLVVHADLWQSSSGRWRVSGPHVKWINGELHIKGLFIAHYAGTGWGLPLYFVRRREHLR